MTEIQKMDLTSMSISEDKKRMLKETFPEVFTEDKIDLGAYTFCQEIGRGMRLPVNRDGERVFDDNINILNVIANESYEEFARKLQNEIEDDFSIKFGRVVNNAFSRIIEVKDGEENTIGSEESQKIWEELKNNGYLNDQGDIQGSFTPGREGFHLQISPEFEKFRYEILKIVKSHLFENRISRKGAPQTLKLNKQIYLDPEFKNLWDRIKQKTAYSVEYDTETLIRNASEALKNIEKIEPARIKILKAGVDIDKRGVSTTLLKDGGQQIVTNISVLPDILAYLQKETNLTRGTLVRILKESGRLKEFGVNPQKFMTVSALSIKRTLNRMILDGIKYEKIAGEVYEMRKFEDEEVTRYLSNIVNLKKSVHEIIVIDSEVERKFAEDLDKREDIKLFVKLPSWFKINTPLGSYNPDWAIVKENDTTLYLVRETKSIRDFEELRNTETYKVKCGKKHFDTLGVDYKVVVEAKEI